MPEHDAVKSGWHPSRESPLAELKQRIRWHVNRLRCMAPEEVRHRVRRALANRMERWGLRGAAVVPPPELANTARHWICAATSVDKASYLQAADRIAAGIFDVFALRDIELGSPPRWNRDPKTGVEAPLSFGKLLDHRNPRLVGDIKYLWELNRHHHIVTLAQACALSGDVRYLGVIRQHLENWFTVCPYRMGPNWSSALEAAIRLINWSVAWQLLHSLPAPPFDEAGGARFRRRWLDSVFQHVQFVQGHLSLYSSANNHLIGEAAGLYAAALTWPCWPQARAWLAQATALLERETLLQNAPDGVNLEQAVSYQQFELELLLHPLLAARANGRKFSASYESRIEAMLEYLASIMDAGGNLPMLGDSDDGVVVRLAQGGEHCRCRSLLEIGAILFRRGDFKAKAGGTLEASRWLFGTTAESAMRQIDATRGHLPVRRAFPTGGYYILGCEFETANEIRLVADAGPLGYQSIAAHGHADALAFTLAVGGQEFFVDTGTYAYHTQPRWRRYFRGTAAHNTVRVDGADQSEPGGNFMWLRKAASGCSLWRPSTERDIFEGWHDGYQRLPDPVMHRRRITLDKAARSVAIEDVLEMAGEHDIELLFHCSERCRVEPLPDGYAISQGNRVLTLRLPQRGDATARVYAGSVTPVCGWISRRFDEKRPAPTIVWRARIAGTCVLKAQIDC